MVAFGLYSERLVWFMVVALIVGGIYLGSLIMIGSGLALVPYNLYMRQMTRGRAWPNRQKDLDRFYGFGTLNVGEEYEIAIVGVNNKGLSFGKVKGSLVFVSDVAQDWHRRARITKADSGVAYAVPAPGAPAGS